MANNKFIRQIKIEADDQGVVPTVIQLLHAGNWNTPWHGDFELTESDINQFVEHFQANVGLPVDSDGKAPINYSHYGGEKAAGWLFNVRAERVNDVLSLVADIEWTPAGKKSLVEGEFRYISPEFNPRALPWEDPEEEWHMVPNVITGAGLTNRPLFKKLKKVAASEIQGSSKKSNQGEPMSLKLEDVRTMEASELKDEHRTFLEENKTQLSADELTKFNMKAADAPVIAAEDGKVQINADELKQLQADAARGVEAAEKLSQKEASDFVSARIQAGQIKSDQKDDLTKMLLASDKEGREAIEKFVEGLPINERINADAKGDEGEEANGTAYEEVKAKTTARVEASSKEGKKLSFSAARKEVLASDAALADRFKEENKGDK